MNDKTRLLWACAAVVVWAWAGAAWAVDEKLPTTIIEVRIRGNDQVPEAAIRVHLHTRAGAEYDEATVRQDKQRLLKTRNFVRVLATRTQTTKGVVVTFTVTERPMVSRITLVGNKALKEAELLKELAFPTGGPLNEVHVREGQEALVARYKTEGFPSVKVTAAIREREVVYQIVEGPRVVIRKIRYRGNKHFHTLGLRLKTETWGRLWPFVPGYLDREKINRDVITLRSLYVSEGFLDVEVAPLLEYSPDKTRVVLTFVIRQNVRYRVAKVIFEGNAVFSDTELQKDLRLRSGEYFTQDELNFDTRVLQEKYGKLGYINATMATDKRFKMKPGLVDLVYRIQEADQYRVGRITIRGNEVTQSRVIRRQLRVYPEQLFNTVAVGESRKRLMELGLFESIQITPVGKVPGVRDVLVEVKEGPTTEFLIGVGVSSNFGVLGNIAFRQRNFDITNWPASWKEFMTAQGWKGAGQRFSMVAEPGTELMRYQVEWFDPMLFDLPYSAGVKAFAFQRDWGEYDEMRLGTVVSFGHRFKNRWYGETAVRAEGIRISGVDKDAAEEFKELDGSHLLLGIKGTLIRDRTDSRWLPSTGDRFRISAEPVTGDFNFTVLRSDYSHYRTVLVDALDRKHILATRVAMGYIAGDAPIFERFYGGGIGSIRGFEYRGVSPRSRSDDEEPVGGDFMIFAGCEYSFPLVGRQVRGVAFLDTGTVEDNFGVSSYRASVGVGVRWIVPLFGPVPISFDFAFPVAKDGNDDTQIFSFSLGWIF